MLKIQNSRRNPPTTPGFSLNGRRPPRTEGTQSDSPNPSKMLTLSAIVGVGAVLVAYLVYLMSDNREPVSPPKVLQDPRSKGCEAYSLLIGQNRINANQYAPFSALYYDGHCPEHQNSSDCSVPVRHIPWDPHYAATLRRAIGDDFFRENDAYYFITGKPGISIYQDSGISPQGLREILSDTSCPHSATFDSSMDGGQYKFENGYRPSEVQLGANGAHAFSVFLNRTTSLVTLQDPLRDDLRQFHHLTVDQFVNSFKKISTCRNMNHLELETFYKASLMIRSAPECRKVYEEFSMTPYRRSKDGYITSDDGVVCKHGSYFRGELDYGHYKTGTLRVTIPHHQTYVGSFKGNVPHGNGTHYQANGDYYVGEFKHGNFNGNGTLNMANGDYYVGEFKRGNFNGNGTLRLSNGDTYHGRFVDGAPSGDGCLTLASGGICNAKFDRGRIGGTGSIKYPNGESYQGEITGGIGHPSNCIKEGRGTLIFPNGQVVTGLFKHNKWVP